LCLALLCLSPLNLAHAAPTPGETDLIRERQDRLLEEQRRRLEELKELPGKAVKPAAPTAPADTRCFQAPLRPTPRLPSLAINPSF
jgi:hemolysin activation/secretion protein